MDDILVPTALKVDLDRNAIDIAIGPSGAAGTEAVERHVLEMGVRGRLLGIELDERYVMVCGPSDEDTGVMRAIEVEMLVRRDRDRDASVISVPRRGAGYEITFPSGNQ